MIDDLIPLEEGDHSAEGSIGDDDLGVGDRRLRRRCGREAIGVWVRAQELADDGGLAGTCCSKKKYAPVTVRVGGEWENVLAEIGRGRPGSGLHAIEEG